MKKFFSAIIIFFLLMANTVAFADNIPSASINVKGNIEVGQNIQILINVSDVKNLYAGAAKFKYDKNILKVTGFQKGDLINKSGVNVFDVGNKIDNDNGIAEFGGFSCLGRVPGFSGSGTFIIIDAQVLKKDNFHVKSVPLLSDPNDDNNLKIQLVDNNAKDMNYNFTGYDFKVNSNGTTAVSQPKSESGNTGNSGSSTDSFQSGNTPSGNPTYSASSGTKNNNESISGTSQNNDQEESGNLASNTGGNNVSSSNENSNDGGDKRSNNVLNNSTASVNNSENASSKTKSGTNSSSKNQATNSSNNSKNLNTNINDSKSKNVSSPKNNNVYIIAGIGVVVVLVLGFAAFFIFKHLRGVKFGEKH